MSEIEIKRDSTNFVITDNENGLKIHVRIDAGGRLSIHNNKCKRDFIFENSDPLMVKHIANLLLVAADKAGVIQLKGDE